MVFFSPAVAGPRPSKSDLDSVLTISDRSCGSNVGASPGGAARAGDSASVIESESSDAAKRVMAYPWRQPVRLPQMLAAPDPGPSTGGAGRELFARSARIRRRQLVAHVQEAGEARYALVRQAVVAVGDHAADRRWRGALGVGEARADAEAQAVRALDNQRAEHAAVFAPAAGVPDHEIGRAHV